MEKDMFISIDGFHSDSKSDKSWTAGILTT